MGIIQGATEFIPVSSTAHLILFSKLFDAGGATDTLSFDVALHMGTLFAVLAYFFREWIGMFTRERKMLFGIIVATIPAGLAGFFLNDLVEETLRNPFIISFALIIIAVVMIIAEKRKRDRALKEMTIIDALVIGLAQVLALIPGVSRSGITISAGLFRNVNREAAARYSFLLSTPVIGGAALLHTYKMLNAETALNMPLLFIGVISSALSGFIAIHFLLGFFRKYSMRSFAYYRIFAGILIMVILWTTS